MSSPAPSSANPDASPGQAMASIDRVGVIGGGIMGAGIAEVCARAACDVVLLEVDDTTVERAQQRVETSLGRAVKATKIDEAMSTAIRGRIRFTTDYADLAACDLVVEAIIEDEAAKVAVFRRLGEVIASPTAILASNTSSIPIIKLGRAAGCPERVVGVHFFNPAPVLPLVEIVPNILTAPDIVSRVVEFAQQRLSKQTVQSKDRAGFIVNALLIPYLLAAIRMLDAGLAPAADIDAGMVAGCAHPMGPLALTDLIGLDTTAAIAASMYEEYKEPLYAAPPLLLRMVDAGLLGRKTGRGFFDYTATRR